VELPDATLRALDELATKKRISRTEALVQAVEETRQIAEMAPHGARIERIDLGGVANDRSDH
jgi:predicted transcriptional regulator